MARTAPLNRTAPMSVREGETRGAGGGSQTAWSINIRREPGPSTAPPGNGVRTFKSKGFFPGLIGNPLPVVRFYWKDRFSNPLVEKRPAPSTPWSERFNFIFLEKIFNFLSKVNLSPRLYSHSLPPNSCTFYSKQPPLHPR